MSAQELKPDVSLSPASATLTSENPGSNPNSSNNENDTNDVGSAGANNSKERRKIEIKFIENKTRRHVTFSKRKHGIMKKAFELSVLTGTQVLLLVVSETGLVYTFSTPKFEPIVTQQEGRNLIQACLNAPDEEEEEEEEEDEEAQRQRLAAQTQQQLAQQQAQQQLAQQHAQQAQQHQAAMQSVQASQQGQQTQQQGQVPLPNAQMSQQQQGALQLQPDNGQDHHQPFSMDGFATPRQVDNDNNNNNNNNMNNNGNKHQDPSGNGQQGDGDGNNSNPNNANNPAYQQYFQSSQQPAQF